MSEPLAGIRVIDVTQYAAGPVATLLLADYGAEVVKVEPVDGDPFRSARTANIAGTNPGFISLNGNKRSVAIDLRNSEGQTIVRQLVQDANVFVENFRPGVADRLNLGYESLRDLNPELVYCSISGFGSDGPYAQRPSVDVIAQAMAGLMDQTGQPNGEAYLVGTPIADYLGGIFGSFGILLSLIDRQSGNPGRHVEVSLIDGLLFVLGVRLAEVAATGINPRRRGSGHTQTAPGGVFHAKDGPFAVAVLNSNAWSAFCGAIGKTDLHGDPRFATNADRVKNNEEMLHELEELFSSKDRAHWLQLVAAEGIPCGPVNDLVDVLADPGLNGILQSISYSDVNGIQVVGPPVKLGTDTTARVSSPLLGSDTFPVLREAGFSHEQIEKWSEARVVKGIDEGAVDSG